MFYGAITALVTPFDDAGHVDYEAFKRLIEYQIQGGVNAVVVAGSTGEASSLDIDEYTKLVQCAVNAVKNRVKVIAGVGSNNTKLVIKMASIAEKAGVDGLMAVLPYYNKPSQLGLVAHYTMLHESTNIPVLLYTVPGRTGIDISDETLRKLSVLERICGLKDASNDIDRTPRNLIHVPSDFKFLSGEDASVVAYRAHGGHGVISVVSNVVPDIVVKVQNLCDEGDYKNALATQIPILNFIRCMFIETNPVPVKYALSQMGLCKPHVRLPLYQLAENNARMIEEIIQNMKNEQALRY